MRKEGSIEVIGRRHLDLKLLEDETVKELVGDIGRLLKDKKLSYEQVNKTLHLVNDTLYNEMLRAEMQPPKR